MTKVRLLVHMKVSMPSVGLKRFFKVTEDHKKKISNLSGLWAVSDDGGLFKVNECLANVKTGYYYLNLRDLNYREIDDTERLEGLLRVLENIIPMSNIRYEHDYFKVGARVGHSLCDGLSSIEEIGRDEKGLFIRSLREDYLHGVASIEAISVSS